MLFLNPIDLAQQELRNARIQNLAADPSSPVVGQMWFNTTLDALRFRTSVGTISLPNTDALTLQGQAGSYYLNRANHSGTQLAATISDFNTAVRTNRLDQMALPTAAVPFNGQKITGLAAGTAAGDALRYEQVVGVFAPLDSPTFTTQVLLPAVAPGDTSNKAATTQFVMDAMSAALTGLDTKASVRVATTANITLSGVQTIDGVAVVAGDRVLVKDQTTASQNGIYVAAAGAWARSTDADQNIEVTPGLYTFTEVGTINADTGFILITDAPITVGTTALTFAQFSGAGQLIAGNGLLKTGNSLAVVGTTNRISVSGAGVDISAAYVGQASIVTVGTIATGTWQGTAVGVLYGGTGATTPAAARANLGAIGRFVQAVGDGTSTSITVTHNLGTVDVDVTLRDATTGAEVQVDNRASSTTQVILTFAVAPAAGAYRVVISG